MTFKTCWKEQLFHKLKQAAETKSKLPKKNTVPVCVAVVGIGNELNGDDAAGILVARKLWVNTEIPANCVSIDAGSLPENASGPLRRFGPDLVIFVDAADFGAAAGKVAWLGEEQIGGFSASSHTLPLTVLGGFLQSELGCRVEYLGIQPLRIEYLQEVTAPVDHAIDEVVAAFEKELTRLS